MEKNSLPTVGIEPQTSRILSRCHTDVLRWLVIRSSIKLLFDIFITQFLLVKLSWMNQLQLSTCISINIGMTIKSVHGLVKNSSPAVGIEPQTSHILSGCHTDVLCGVVVTPCNITHIMIRNHIPYISLVTNRREGPPIASLYPEPCWTSSALNYKSLSEQGVYHVEQLWSSGKTLTSKSIGPRFKSRWNPCSLFTVGLILQLTSSISAGARDVCSIAYCAEWVLT